jgi:hypothetical protein
MLRHIHAGKVTDVAEQTAHLEASAALFAGTVVAVGGLLVVTVATLTVAVQWVVQLLWDVTIVVSIVKLFTFRIQLDCFLT